MAKAITNENNDGRLLQPDRLSPCSRPFKTLDELDKWKPDDPSCRSHVPLNSRAHALLDTPRTIACHDYKSQYLDDRFVQGGLCEDNYVFYNWQYVDMFIYFSHHFITVPPLVWVSASHRHGVPILGTLITEHEEGRLRCLEILSHKDTYMRLVEKLVDLAEYYNFDGWLVNIENAVPEDRIDNLVDFVRELRQCVAKRLRHGHVMWYDSVVAATGDLIWQNALNENNQKFFDVADSIFLNYAWSTEDLEKSQKFASVLGRRGDVYVGVDVFGRDMKHSRGGFHTDQALQHVRELDLSAVLFAFPWVFEKNAHDQFYQNEYRFWEKLHDLCPQHGTASLPLSSHFCRGRGKAFFYHGQDISTQPWYNMALQSLQPSYTQTQFRHHHITPIVMSYHSDEAFLGGGCLRLSTPACPDGHTTIFKLFACDVALSKGMFVSYTVKCNDASDAFLELRLERAGERRALMLCENDRLRAEEGHGGDVVYALSVEDASDVLKDYTNWVCLVGQTQWVTRCFVLDERDIGGWTLTCVSVGLHQKISVDCPPYETECGVTCETLLGQIQMNAVSLFNHHPPFIKDTHFTRDSHTQPPTNSGWLSWTTDQPDKIDFCNIYMYSGLDLDNLTLLGHSSTDTFRVSDLGELTNWADISLLIQPALYSGFVESISMCRSISLDADVVEGAK